MIPENSVNAIKDSIDIVQMIGEFTSLKRRGNNYLGLCPFHNEKTPSFVVSPVKGTYKCFGCGQGGGAINFIMEHERLTYPEALSYIADKNNILIERSEEQFKSSKDLFSLLAFANEFFQQQYLNNGNPAESYARSRGMDNNNTFFQGYAQGGKLLSTAALKAGFTSEQLIEAGLLGVSEKGVYDYFIDRLVFPYFDLMGRVIGFTGRKLVENSTFPKYFNSPETTLFHKGKVLFGIHQAKRSIDFEDECILVEGQIDVVSLHKAGIQNVVCTSGTALSSDQIKLIRRFTTNVTVIFDADKAGIAATIKSIDSILCEGMNAWVVTLPEGEDPDSFSREKSLEEIRAYIESNRKDWIDYRYNFAVIGEFDNDKKIDLVKELATSCSLIPDEITRAGHMKKVSSVFSFPYEALESAIKRKLPEIIDNEGYSGFFAFEEAKEAITLEDEAMIYPSNKNVIEHHLEERTNSIGLPMKPLSKSNISDLAACSKNIRIKSEVTAELIQQKNNPIIELALELVKNHFNVLVLPCDELGFSTPMVSFVDYYISALIRNLSSSNSFNDDKSKKKAVEKTAELISMLDNTSITLKSPWAADKFDITTAAFSKILKPFIDRKKNVSSQSMEDIVIDEKRYYFDIENLPPYVDKRFFYRYGFFPAQNEAGKKIFYVFRTSENTLVKVANFYLAPLFQVFDLDPNKNKRIVQLNHAELGTSEFVEMLSSMMMDFNSFKKLFWNQGGYVFSKGKPYMHELILESIALSFPKCYEFSTYGWQPEGFFAFANGTYADNVFTPVDELGLVKYMEDTYYSPAFSKIYASQRKDSDKYVNDRFLVHKSAQDTTWQQWCNLIDEVYKYDDNGRWAIIFTMLATHRSVIFPVDRFFTSLFFIGPTDSGKSRIAESIRAPFMYGAPLFNLNSGTDAAFFTVMERYRDVPVIFEEYNDHTISDTKFQGLKAAVYDNEGKTKRKEAGTKELDISQVNCAPLLLGQEVPEKDDNSLANRCIICHVHKKDDWSDDEINSYLELKEREKSGLTNICLAMLSKRPEIKKHWPRVRKEVSTAMKDALIKEGSPYQTRILNIVSMMATMAKLWEEIAPEFKLPFTYKEFFVLAKQKIVTQSESINQTNKLAMFFDSISSLLTQEHGIVIGREFKIEPWNEVIIQKSKTETEKKKFDHTTNILYLRINMLHPMYQNMHKGDALKVSALMMYLKDHDSYIGPVRSTRFEWKQQVEVEGSGGYLERHLNSASINTSAVMLNYDTLGIDLQKFKVDDAGTPSTLPTKNLNPTVATQEVIPFYK